MSVERVLDAGGVPFYIGARVHIDGEHPIDEAIGTVTEITDLDGDMVDGQTVGIMPIVKVTFDDETDDEYTATMRFPDDDLRVVDLRLLPCPTCGDANVVSVPDPHGRDPRDPDSLADALDCPTCSTGSGVSKYPGDAQVAKERPR